MKSKDDSTIESVERAFVVPKSKVKIITFLTEVYSLAEVVYRLQ